MGLDDEVKRLHAAKDAAAAQREALLARSSQARPALATAFEEFRDALVRHAVPTTDLVVVSPRPGRRQRGYDARLLARAWPYRGIYLLEDGDLATEPMHCGLSPKSLPDPSGPPLLDLRDRGRLLDEATLRAGLVPSPSRKYFAEKWAPKRMSIMKDFSPDRIQPHKLKHPAPSYLTVIVEGSGFFIDVDGYHKEELVPLEQDFANYIARHRV